MLLVIVKCIHETGAQEDMLICKSVPTKTTAEEIFNLMDSRFKKLEIYWDLCHQVCIDGTKAMLGKSNGMVAHMKQKILV